MSDPKWLQFWKSLLGEHEFYQGHEFANISIVDLKRGVYALRVYRNKDGTWSAMPNWMGKDKPYATNYTTFQDAPVGIQEKLGVLLLQDAGSDWLDGIGRRVDDDVFWLEDG